MGPTRPSQRRATSRLRLSTARLGVILAAAVLTGCVLDPAGLEWTPSAAGDAGEHSRGDGGDAGAEDAGAQDAGPCGSGGLACDGGCVDAQTDDENCGQCGVACAASVACVGGHCRRFVADAGAGVVYDVENGDVWQRDCAPEHYTQSDALGYCLSLDAGGFSSGRWFLPSGEQVARLVDMTWESPKLDHDAFPGSPAECFWSSSLFGGLDYAAWAFNFHDGNGYGRITSGKCYVRCVR